METFSVDLISSLPAANDNDKEILFIQSVWRMVIARRLFLLTVNRIKNERKRTFEQIQQTNNFVNTNLKQNRHEFLRVARDIIFQNMPGISLETERIYGRRPNEMITIKAKKDTIGRTCVISCRQHSSNSIFFSLNPTKQSVHVKCFKCPGSVELHKTSSVFQDTKHKIVVSEKEPKRTKTKEAVLENLDEIAIVKFEHRILHLDNSTILEFYDSNRFCQIPAKLTSKAPAFSNWTKRTFEDNTNINFSYNNLAIACGKVSGVFVIDVDVSSNGLKWFQQLCSKNNYNYPNQTFVVQTPSQGLHLYYKYNEAFSSNSVRMLCGTEAIGIDIRSTNGIVVAPPSKYEKSDGTYGKYEILSMKTPCECPDFLVSALTGQCM